MSITLFFARRARWALCWQDAGLIALLIGTAIIPIRAHAQATAPTQAGTTAPDDPAAATFTQKCAGCHTIGKGPMTGPDLAGTVARPEQDIAANIKRMEDRTGPLADAEIQRLVMLLKDPEAARRIAAGQQQQAKSAEATLVPPSARIGKRLFEGAQPLHNGGMACLACHRVNGQGGTLARDLTTVNTRMGQAALASSIKAAGFKIMNATYRDHPITAQEAAHLAGYLASLRAQPVPAAPHVPVVGLLSGILLMGGILALYGTRKPGARARLPRR
ncbi:MAG: c-type cytochrome [Armatimonadota bacterium]